MFSRIIHIPPIGIVKVTIGGMPEALPNEIGANDSTVREIQPQSGYDVPPRNGLLWIRSPNNDAAIRDVTATVVGIDGHVITPDLPGRVITELPCQVEVRGAPGVAVLVTAWATDPSGERGAARSVLGVGSHTIPLWATTVDAAGVLVSFFDNAAVAIGTFVGPIVGLSIPPNANTMTLAGATDCAIFRQG